ncbi:MAG: glycosyltransferase [Verrucomicrobiales bacterium]
MRLSVCICTYNGEKRIPLVIRALKEQDFDCEDWEVIIVDNASTDETLNVAKKLISEELECRSKVVLERNPGLSHARSCAANEAQGDVVCFLDDDNIPARDWVSSVSSAFCKFENAGVIGGKVLPRWEVPPPPLAEAVAPFALAICDLGDKEQRIDHEGGGIVGAGMCIRTKLLREIYNDPKSPARVTGRIGNNLMSGEDLVISILAREKGWECWYVPSMSINHCLPASRTTKEYLLRLYDGIGRGQAATRRIYDGRARSPLALLISLKDLFRWIELYGKSIFSSSQIRASSLDSDLRDLHRSQLRGRILEALRFY